MSQLVKSMTKLADLARTNAERQTMTEKRLLDVHNEAAQTSSGEQRAEATALEVKTQVDRLAKVAFNREQRMEQEIKELEARTVKELQLVKKAQESAEKHAIESDRRVVALREEKAKYEAQVIGEQDKMARLQSRLIQEEAVAAKQQEESRKQAASMVQRAGAMQKAISDLIKRVQGWSGGSPQLP